MSSDKAKANMNDQDDNRGQDAITTGWALCTAEDNETALPCFW